MPSLPVMPPRPKAMFPKKQMSEFPVDGSPVGGPVGPGGPCCGENGGSDGPLTGFQTTGKVASAVESLQQHHSVESLQHLSSSSSKLASNQTSQMLSNSCSSTTTRVAKTSTSSARVHHVSASSSASSVKSDLSELKSSISEMKNLSSLKFVDRLRSPGVSVDEELEGPPPGGGPEPVITFPDTPESPTPVCMGSPVHMGSSSSAEQQTLKFEQKRITSASSTKVVSSDGVVAEKASANSAQVKRMEAGDVSYEEATAQAQMRARLEMDGISAEKSLNMLQEQRSLKSGEITQQECQNLSAATMRLQTESFSAEKKAMETQQQRRTITSSGVINQEKHLESNITFTSKTKKSSTSMMTAQMSQMLNGQSTKMIEEPEILGQNFEDLETLSAESSSQEVEKAISKYTDCLEKVVTAVRRDSGRKSAVLLDRVNEMMRKAWAVPTHGHELGSSLCNTLRKSGGLDILLSHCSAETELQFSCARVLEQCLTTENRDHVVANGLEKVVITACVCTKHSNSSDHSRVGTGILEHLFKHSEATCSDVVNLGGLDAILFECRKNDVETLRHCAGALANLSLYGGADNQEAMIKRKVPVWLFPLAFHNDDNIKYYACLAIAVLVANSEIEAAVLKSGTLDLVEPFVTSHNPSDFARSNLAHAHGQSKHWLQRLVPVLSSKREEARNLAAFHFCMEAGIKKTQGNTEIFREIGAIEPLKKVASCPNAIASKYAAQALRLIGEEVPHKLSQQVPLWSVEDVREWVKQIGFAEYANNFTESRVDGDLLLQLTEENLSSDIGITNGIRRRRFTRELQNLKKMSDYSSRDASNLNSFLMSIAPEFSIYTYSMLNAGVEKEALRCLTEDQLVNECGITNSIHRLKILESIKALDYGFSPSFEEKVDKSLDVFVSYRRSNGSQLASLLKVHLQLRGFSVFIDVERLEAGKFDNNLLQSIRQAKNFILVLTPNALERCIADTECKDWVHKEIVAALQSQCNIIPIIDNFQWPEPEELPEDMRAVCHFNGVRWIHDYQDACVDKLERFMRSELNRVGMGDGRGATIQAASLMISKGDVTPGTPSVNPRHPPSYHRMASSHSGEGSDHSRD